MILDVVCGIDIFLSIDLNVFWWLALVAGLGWAGLGWAGGGETILFMFQFHDLYQVWAQRGDLLQWRFYFKANYRTNVQDWSENSKSGKISKNHRQTIVI